MSKRMQWSSEDTGALIEVMPVTDEKKHYSGDECWCNPSTETINGRKLFVHNTYDNCKSYNWDIGETPEVILPRPDWMQDGERVNGVPVDACIADVVEHLWDKGVITLNSCCGHGREIPSLVLGQGEADYKKIEEFIADKDSRTFKLLQWKLVQVPLREEDDGDEVFSK